MSIPWAALLQQLFELDPLVWPTCHSVMRIVAFITQPSVIDQILTHLRARATTAHPGARLPIDPGGVGTGRQRDDTQRPTVPPEHAIDSANSAEKALDQA